MVYIWAWVALALPPLTIEAFPETYKKPTVPIDAISIVTGANLFAEHCINCHGPVDSLTEGTKAQILSEYPFDKAVGYSVGQIRGAVSYKKPL